MLLVSTLLLVICLSFATMSVLNLNLSSAYRNSTQCRFLAMAATTQVCSELASFRRQGWRSPLDAERPSLDLLERYRKPVFAKGAENLPGEVVVTFDNDLDHYSVDNLDSPYPAAGWTDRGSDRKSVPPFSLSLVIGARVSGQLTWFEAIVTRRWPFVVCTPGRFTLMGTLDRRRLAAEGLAIDESPTQVRGAVYSLLDAPSSTISELLRPSFDFTRPPMDDEAVGGGEEGLEKTAPRSLQREDVLEVGREVFDRVQYVPGDAGAVTVGGAIVGRFFDGEGILHESVRCDSRGNRLNGTVYSVADSAENVLDVAAGNHQRGGIRVGQHLTEVDAVLQRAFIVEEPSDCTVLQPQPQARPPVKVATDAKGVDASTAEKSDVGVGGIAPPPSRMDAFYKLEKTLVLGSDNAGEPGFGLARGSRYRIPCSVGNRWREAGRYKESGAGLQISNALLYVDGNLDLSASSGEEGGNPFLRGTNATIIVRGTLSLSSARIDALDQGMVIYAGRLVSEASGSLKGLLLVEKGALFFPPGGATDSSQRLLIQGAIICGDSPTIVRRMADASIADGAVSPAVGAAPSPSPVTSTGSTRQDEVITRGVCLWSTDLVYDARYLKSLHPMAPATVSVLRQIE